METIDRQPGVHMNDIGTGESPEEDSNRFPVVFAFDQQIENLVPSHIHAQCQELNDQPIAVAINDQAR